MKQLMQNRKGVFDQLSGLAIGMASLAIVLIVVFLILANVESNAQVAADSNATKAVKTIATSTDQIPTWIPLVVIAVIGGLLISLVAVFRR